jgi:phosphoribosylformylglycinamidine cyclo-ligase
MMYNTYNMGIGMVLAVDPEKAEDAIGAIREAGDQAYVIGRIAAGEKGVDLI